MTPRYLPMSRTRALSVARPGPEASAPSRRQTDAHGAGMETAGWAGLSGQGRFGGPGLPFGRSTFSADSTAQTNR